MKLINEQGIHLEKLSDSDFARLSKFIYSEYGIKMPPEKKVMLQNRLQKRLRALNFNSFKPYVDFVFSSEGTQEVVLMINEVSTNKTDFYRESAHFDYLKSTILPKLYKEKRNIKLWSAGCSSGAEMYTLAIELTEFASSNPGLNFSILGTDISTKMLEKAYQAIYPAEMVHMVPMELKKKYLLKSKDKTKNLIRINKELRSKVKFKRLNFMDSTYSVDSTYDIIFCRNVLIYFDRPTQENVINKLCQHISPGGYLFLGHSETINNMNSPLERLQPTIYKKI